MRETKTVRELFLKEEQGTCKLRFLFKQEETRCILLQGKDGLVAEAQSRAVRLRWPQKFPKIAQQTPARVPGTPEFLSSLSVEWG